MSYERRVVLCRGAGLFHKPARPVVRALVPGQPMLLIREPGNKVDPNAIIVADLFGVSISYINRTSAIWLAPALDAGTLYLAKVTRIIGVPRADFYIRIFKQPPEEIERSAGLPEPGFFENHDLTKVLA